MVAMAAVAVPVVVSAAPTCVAPGVATRVVIYGSGWPGETVTLSRNEAGVTTPLGTATPRTSPVRNQAGSFSATRTITAGASFRITAAVGELVRNVDVAVSTSCPLLLTVKPDCLSAPGTVPVQVTGANFVPGSQVPLEVDPFGNAEAQPLTVGADKDGAFSTAVPVAFAGAPVPIVASRFNNATTVVLPPVRAVAFVNPCPPAGTTTSTTRPPANTTTTRPKAGPTTTTGAPPPGDPPPEVPPVRVPTPGATADVSISPLTVRPGRCVVIVVAAAPPALPVIARFADGPPVNGVTGPDGGAVVSVCHSHDSGIPLGPVKVLIGIGPAPPAPVFTVLRVPPRPQPPLLQSGSDSRRS
jgi:hypothetical protein